MTLCGYCTDAKCLVYWSWRDGGIRTTERLAVFLESFNLSLTQLAPLNDASVVCEPVFGSMRRKVTDSAVFVVMPFAEALKPVYEDHIKAVAQTLDLSVTRADDFFTADSVMSDVWAALTNCRVVIADCTGRNPNVFYELGIAHTLGRSTILVAQDTKDIPFDIHHIRTIIYDFTPRGMREFEESLHKTLKWVLIQPTSLADFLRSSGSKLEGSG